jgi:hypothetical protein
MVSEDTSGNVSVSTEYSFTTLEIQESHPNLTNPGNPLIAQYSDTEAVVYLPAANTEATSKICWDTNAITDINNCTNHSEINTPTKSHYYHLTGLTPNTTYHIMTKITDSETNTINYTSNDITFETKEVQVNQHGALSKISNVADPPSVLTDTTAVVTFDTDAPALCMATVTTAQGSYDNPLIYKEDGYDQKENYNIHHSININGLIFATKYYYEILCGDDLNTAISSTEFNFTTLQKQTSHTMLSSAAHDSAPTILTKTDTEAILTFNAGTAADSKLCVDKSNNINMDTCTGVTPPVTNSSIQAYHLTNLDPETTYYAKMKLIDSADNTNTYTTDEVSFTTLPAQVAHTKLSAATHDVDPTVTLRTDTEAIVSFNAGTEASSKLCYATVSGIDMENCTGENSTGDNKLHTFHLSALTPSTIYYVKMKLTDSEDSSDAYTTGEVSFTTKEKLYTKLKPMD